MKLFRNPSCVARHPGRAFTLVEIVLSLAIVAIALVAIIGVLPIGLNVQTDNQEESIVSADAAIWMEAFRSGAQGMEYLVQDDVNGNDFYIDEVRVRAVERTRDPTGVSYQDDPVVNTRTNYFSNFTSASNLLGLLSLPKLPPNYPAGLDTTYTSWETYVDMRALNGNMADLGADIDFAFKYRMIPEIVPVQALSPFHLVDTNRNLPLRIIQTNLFELRLNFKWPLVVGEGGRFREQTRFAKSLTFRTLVSGQLIIRTNEASGELLYFMGPRQYSYLTNPPPANP